MWMLTVTHCHLFLQFNAAVCQIFITNNFITDCRSMRTKRKTTRKSGIVVNVSSQRKNKLQSHYLNLLVLFNVLLHRYHWNTKTTLDVALFSHLIQSHYISLLLLLWKENDLLSASFTFSELIKYSKIRRSKLL